MAFAVDVVDGEVEVGFFHALHIPEVDGVEVGAGEAEGAFFADDGEFGAVIFAEDADGGVEGADSAVFKTHGGGDGVVNFESPEAAADAFVFHDLAEEEVEHVHVVACLGVENAAVQGAGAVPVDLEIIVVAVPEDVAVELVDFPQGSVVDQFFGESDEGVVAVLVDGEEGFARGINAVEHFMGFADGQRQGFFAEDIGDVGSFGDFGDMAGVEAGGGEDGGDVHVPDLPVVGEEGNVELFGAGFGFGFVVVADQGDLEVWIFRDGFDVAVDDAAAADEGYFFHG